MQTGRIDNGTPNNAAFPVTETDSVRTTSKRPGQARALGRFTTNVLLDPKAGAGMIFGA
jgi:hypothetical protein